MTVIANDWGVVNQIIDGRYPNLIPYLGRQLIAIPHRGRPCEPAYVADTARFLAELREEPLEQLAAGTSANFRRLFARAAAA